MKEQNSTTPEAPEATEPKENGSAAAPEVTLEVALPGDGTQLDFFGLRKFADESDGKLVFEPKTDEKGVVIAQTVKLQKRSEIAKHFQLKAKDDKELIDEKVEEAGDELLGKMEHLLVELRAGRLSLGKGIRGAIAKGDPTTVNWTLRIQQRGKRPVVSDHAVILALAAKLSKAFNRVVTVEETVDIWNRQLEATVKAEEEQRQKTIQLAEEKAKAEAEAAAAAAKAKAEAEAAAAKKAGQQTARGRKLAA